MFKFNLSMITDKKDIPFIMVIERFKSSSLDLNLLRSCVKKSDREVIRYFKQNGYVSLYRKFIELFTKYEASGALTENLLGIPLTIPRISRIKKLPYNPFGSDPEGIFSSDDVEVEVEFDEDEDLNY